MHAVIAHSFEGRDDSTRVLGQKELLFLYSMVERCPIHLGYMLVDFISYQGQHILLGEIFTGPYIMRWIKGMGLVDWL